MTHEYDAAIGIFELGKSEPQMQISIKFCTCGNQLRSCKRIHSQMDMYHFVTYGVQSVINNYQKCGLRDLMVVLATALPKEITQYHMWFETEPKIPTDARYCMSVEVHDCDYHYPDIQLSDVDKVPLEEEMEPAEGFMSMLKDVGMQVYSVDEEGMHRM